MIIEKFLKITCGECFGNCYSDVLNSSVSPLFFALINAFELSIILSFVATILYCIYKKRVGDLK